MWRLVVGFFFIGVGADFSIVFCAKVVQAKWKNRNVAMSVFEIVRFVVFWTSKGFGRIERYLKSRRNAIFKVSLRCLRLFAWTMLSRFGWFFVGCESILGIWVSVKSTFLMVVFDFYVSGQYAGWYFGCEWEDICRGSVPIEWKLWRSKTWTMKSSCDYSNSSTYTYT